MEIEELTKVLIKYYGEHQSKFVFETAIRYIKSNYEKNNYNNLLQAIMKSHPFNYGFPDVCAIETAQSTLYVKEGKSIRKQTTATEWTTNIEPLTEEEIKNAEQPRQEWEAFQKKIGLKVLDINCDNCMYFGGKEKNYECRGCISLSNHRRKEG